MNKVELISEEYGKKKYTHKWDNVPLFDMNKYYKQQECVGECIKMQGKLEIWT